MAKKKSARPDRHVKSTRTLETAYPFPLKPDRDYRLTFRNGQSVVYHGAALASNPQVPLAEMVSVRDETTGQIIFEVPKEEEAKPEPGFYKAQ